MAELTSGRLLGALTVEEISETLKQLDKKLGCSLLSLLLFMVVSTEGFKI